MASENKNLPDDSNLCPAETNKMETVDNSGDSSMKENSQSTDNKQTSEQPKKETDIASSVTGEITNTQDNIQTTESSKICESETLEPQKPEMVDISKSVTLSDSEKLQSSETCVSENLKNLNSSVSKQECVQSDHPAEKTETLAQDASALKIPESPKTDLEDTKQKSLTSGASEQECLQSDNSAEKTETLTQGTSILKVPESKEIDLEDTKQKIKDSSDDMETDKPLAKADKPLEEPDKPLAEADKPLEEADKPLEEPDKPSANSEKPLEEADKPSKEANIFSGEAENPSEKALGIDYENQASKPKTDDKQKQAPVSISSTVVKSIKCPPSNLETNLPSAADPQKSDKQSKDVPESLNSKNAATDISTDQTKESTKKDSSSEQKQKTEVQETEESEMDLKDNCNNEQAMEISSSAVTLNTPDSENVTKAEIKISIEEKQSAGVSTETKDQTEKDSLVQSSSEDTGATSTETKDVSDDRQKQPMDDSSSKTSETPECKNNTKTEAVSESKSNELPESRKKPTEKTEPNITKDEDKSKRDDKEVDATKNTGFTTAKSTNNEDITESDKSNETKTSKESIDNTDISESDKETAIFKEAVESTDISESDKETVIPKEVIESMDISDSDKVHKSKVESHETVKNTEQTVDNIDTLTTETSKDEEKNVVQSNVQKDTADEAIHTNIEKDIVPTNVQTDTADKAICATTEKKVEDDAEKPDVHNFPVDQSTSDETKDKFHSITEKNVQSKLVDDAVKTDDVDNFPIDQATSESEKDAPPSKKDAPPSNKDAPPSKEDAPPSNKDAAPGDQLTTEISKDDKQSEVRNFTIDKEPTDEPMDVDEDMLETQETLIKKDTETTDESKVKEKLEDNLEASGDTNLSNFKAKLDIKSKLISKPVMSPLSVDTSEDSQFSNDIPPSPSSASLTKQQVVRPFKETALDGDADNAMDVPMFDDTPLGTPISMLASDTNDNSVNPEDTIASVASTEAGPTPAKKPRMGSLISARQEFGKLIITVDKLYEYQWPQEIGDWHMLQEQVSEYLNIKSFKRKYPEMYRRFVDKEEKEFLMDRGVVTETHCDLGLTAVKSEDIYDLMFKDYPEKYQEFTAYMHGKQRDHIFEQHKGYDVPNVEKSKMAEYLKKAVKATSEFNAQMQKERREERRAFFDLQTFNVHFPNGKYKKLPAHLTKPSAYPIALIPGQFQQHYTKYTPDELKYLPINTAMYDAPKRMEPVSKDDNQLTSEVEDSQGDKTASSDGDSDGSSDSDSNSDDDKEGGDTEKDKEQTKAEPVKETTCRRCEVKNKNKKRARKVKEDIINCSECGAGGHPTCLELTEEMVGVIQTYPWQCMECKTCVECMDPYDEDKMMFCDRCDRGYHTFCVGVKSIPTGRWECKSCKGATNTETPKSRRGRQKPEQKSEESK